MGKETVPPANGNVGRKRCRVIPFPVSGLKARQEESILARHHVVLEVGQQRYDLDVLGFVRRLPPARSEDGRTVRLVLTGSGTEREAAVVVQVLTWSQTLGQGWRAVLQLKGSKEAWEQYWRQLGIGGGPAIPTDQIVKVPLGLWPRPSGPSSRATSGQNKVRMMNTENGNPGRTEGASAAVEPSVGIRKATTAEAAPESRKRSMSAARTTRQKSWIHRIAFPSPQSAALSDISLARAANRSDEYCRGTAQGQRDNVAPERGRRQDPLEVPLAHHALETRPICSPCPSGKDGLAVVKDPISQRSRVMIFTIDIDNNICIHEGEAEAEQAVHGASGTVVVRSDKELSEAAAEWPSSRLVALWNSFAGVTPFTDCKPVQKFENRGKAVARIWAAIQRLGKSITPPPAEAHAAGRVKKATRPKGAEDTKAATKSKTKKGKQAGADTPRPGTHKMRVIAMLQRQGGATLQQIVKATGWQKHTVRGFISILGSKGGMKITSTRRPSDGARVYEA